MLSINFEPQFIFFSWISVIGFFSLFQMLKLYFLNGVQDSANFLYHLGLLSGLMVAVSVWLWSFSDFVLKDSPSKLPAPPLILGKSWEFCRWGHFRSRDFFSEGDYWSCSPACWCTASCPKTSFYVSDFRTSFNPSLRLNGSGQYCVEVSRL